MAGLHAEQSSVCLHKSVLSYLSVCKSLHCSKLASGMTATMNNSTQLLGVKISGKTCCHIVLILTIISGCAQGESGRVRSRQSAFGWWFQHRQWTRSERRRRQTPWWAIEMSIHCPLLVVIKVCLAKHWVQYEWAWQENIAQSSRE